MVIRSRRDPSHSQPHGRASVLMGVLGASARPAEADVKQKKQMLCRIRKSWGSGEPMGAAGAGEASARAGAGTGHTDKNWAGLLSTPDLCVQAYHPSARRHCHAQPSAAGAAADQLSERCPDLKDRQCEEVLELRHLLRYGQGPPCPWIACTLCPLFPVPQVQ